MNQSSLQDHPVSHHSIATKLVLIELGLAPSLALLGSFGLVRSADWLHTVGWAAEFWYKLAFCAFLVLAGGLFAGLTLGLLRQVFDWPCARAHELGLLVHIWLTAIPSRCGSLDLVNLEVLQSAGEPATQRHATKVYKLLHRGRHWVLVTLLLSNVVVNESLPIFLHGIVGGGAAAVVLSTAAIVIFGEASHHQKAAYKEMAGRMRG